VSDYTAGNVLRYYGPINLPPGKNRGDPFPSGTNTGAIFATRSSFTKPRGLLFASDGKLYVAGLENGVGAIDRFNSDGSFDRVIASNDGHLGVPNGLTWDASGKLDVSIGQGANGKVLQYDSDGNYLKDLVTSQPLTYPYGLAIGGATGNLFVAANGDNNIKQFKTDTGESVPPVPVADGGGLNQPEYLLFHA
jgi:sugar lactone lactonase YvrE